MAMVYAVCRCANEIEAFRYRFLDGKIVLFDRIDTAFTYLGKYYVKDGRTVMPLSVQAHHSFVDGIHIGEFADGLQNYLNHF